MFTQKILENNTYPENEESKRRKEEDNVFNSWKKIKAKSPETCTSLGNTTLFSLQSKQVALRITFPLSDCYLNTPSQLQNLWESLWNGQMLLSCFMWESNVIKWSFSSCFRQIYSINKNPLKQETILYKIQWCPIQTLAAKFYLVTSTEYKLQLCKAL